MFDIISATNEFDDLSAYSSNISFLEYSNDWATMRENVRRFAIQKMERNEVMHFVMYYPFPLNLPNPLLHSDTTANLRYLNFKGKIANLLMMLFAEEVDILDPERGEGLRKLFFWNRDKINITSNTFVDTELYTARRICPSHSGNIEEAGQH